jgi:CLIP-associating protein 1/2
MLEGTNAIRGVLTTKSDLVYGLTTIHANLRLCYAEVPPSPEGEEVKASTFAFGLMALGKYFLRLLAEKSRQGSKHFDISLYPFSTFLLVCSLVL